MYVGLKDFTGAINKITDMVSSDKTVPGVLLRLAKDESDETAGILSVGYTDGHKAVVQELKVQLEETDKIGDTSTTYEQLSAAIASCQPHGKIEVDTLRLEYFPESLKLSIEQFISTPDETGENTVRTKMGNKIIDVVCLDLEKNIKAKVLLRQKYENIFKGEQLDEYDRVELIDLLNRTSTEKGKLIYFSSVKQEVLVANQAHAVACKVSGYELSEDEKQFIKQELAGNGITDEEAFNKVCKEKTDRIHSSFVIFQQMAKSVSSILNRLVSDTVYVEVANSFCNIFVDNDDEKVGICFELPKGSKVHLNYVESFSSLDYKTYQLTFLKDLIEDAIKQALNTTKSEQVKVKIEAETDEETGRTAYYMTLAGGSASASTSNMNRFRADDAVDSVGDLVSKEFNISLKVVLDMISQIKTDLLTFDVDVSDNDSVKIRIAEIDLQKQIEQYNIMRADLDANTPTPIERKLEARDKTLGMRQFTMLSK